MKFSTLTFTIAAISVINFSCTTESEAVIRNLNAYQESLEDEEEREMLEELVDEVIDEMMEEEAIEEMVDEIVTEIMEEEETETEVTEVEVEEMVEEVVDEMLEEDEVVDEMVDEIVDEIMEEEEVTEEDITDEAIEEMVEEEIEETVEEMIDGEDANEITSETVCSFEDLGVVSGNEVDISCLVDLNGETVSVPNNVTLSFAGGDIYNGTLSFESGGKIDGALMNSKLTLEGDVVLTSEEFHFIPQRWEIVEATSITNPTPPSLADAFNNHIILQSTVEQVNSMGATTFSIDTMNAFFDSMNGTDDPRPSVLIPPSNFHLQMTDNTYFRVLPTSGLYSSRLIYVLLESDITLTGGNFIGDRLEHGPISNDVGGVTLVAVKGSQNVLIDGLKISNSSHSGLTINSYSFIERDDYVLTDNVTVQNCILDNNRTNNISVTDGQNIVIEGNQSYNAGSTVQGAFGTSEGIQPKIGIVVETDIMQYIENVAIRNNIVDGTFIDHSILAIGATNIDIIGNTADKSVGWTTAINVDVSNNTCRNITGGFDTDLEQFRGVSNVVSGNTVSGHAGSAIFLTNQDVQVFDNHISDCTAAFQLSSLSDVDIYNNTITTDKAGSIGIIGQNFLDNVTIRDNTFNLSDGKVFNITHINNEVEHADYLFNFNNNKVTASSNGVVLGSNMIISENDFIDSGLVIGTANNIVLEKNSVLSSGDFVSFQVDNSENIEIIGNAFENTNDGPFAVGVTFSNASNINFSNNNVKAIGINYGMFVGNTNEAINIVGNTIENVSEIRDPLHFLGSNSQIINNSFINANGKSIFVDGTNNNVSGN